MKYNYKFKPRRGPYAVKQSQAYRRMYSKPANTIKRFLYNKTYGKGRTKGMITFAPRSWSQRR